MIYPTSKTKCHMKGHSLGWWLFRAALITWLIVGVWWTKGGKRDYRIHPVTDEEIEGLDMIHSR